MFVKRCSQNFVTKTHSLSLKHHLHILEEDNICRSSNMFRTRHLQAFTTSDNVRIITIREWLYQGHYYH